MVLTSRCDASLRRPAMSSSENVPYAESVHRGGGEQGSEGEEIRLQRL